VPPAVAVLPSAVSEEPFTAKAETVPEAAFER